MFSLLLAMLTVLAFPSRPATAIPVGVANSPCGIVLTFFDTDGNPDNGAEWNELTADGRLLGVVIYGDGDDATFHAGYIQVGGKILRFDSPLELNETIGHPCNLVSRPA